MVTSVNCRLSLYADDSALIYSDRSADLVAGHLSNELASCQRWLVDNKLSLHLGKTESILFGAKGRLKRAGDFTINCNGAAVKRVNHVKYLGVILDCYMAGN